MTSPKADEEQIFNTARRINDPSSRAEYLDGACAGDSSLRARVGGLLEIHEQERTDVNANGKVEATVDLQGVALAPGQQIGPYKLLQNIGEGGFGMVYMAEQLKPFRRKVALKVIKAGMDTKEVIARFEAERQALALMDHPNIAKVLDAGTTEQGRPYFVMELVNGVPITDFCDEAKLPPRDRLSIFATVCKAVQHAHQKGVIHRDIKPSNVLVTLHGEEPVPVIIDFGVAKAVSQPLTEKTLFTRFGQMVGTPQYMSPEQSGISGLDVDTRSDVYSLGVLLYELMTGTTPLESQRLRSAAFAEIARLIQEEESPRLSTRLSSLSERLPIICQQRGTDQKKLLQLMRGDLDWIAMKAIEKDRGRRYETASALGEDVARYLADEPVAAGPPSTWYRYQKLFQRKRRLLTTAALFLLAILLGLLGTSVGWRQATLARRVADNRYVEARLAREDAKASQVVAENQRDLTKKTAAALERELYTSRLEAIHVDLGKGNLKRAKSTLDLCSAHLRHWEWEHLNSRAQISYQLHLDGYLWPQFNEDGEVTAMKDQTKQEVVCWDSNSGDLVWEFQNPEQGKWRLFAISHDQSKIVGHDFKTMKLWDTKSGEELWTQEMSRWRWLEPRFSPDDSEICRLLEDTVEIRSAADGSVIRSRKIGNTQALAYSPDGRLLLAGNLLLDAKNLRRVVARLEVEDVSYLCGAVSANNDYVLTGGGDGRVRLWDASTGKMLRAFDAHQGRIYRVSIGPNGRRIASVGADATVRIGDLTDSKATELALLGAHDGAAHHLAFSVDGRKLATTGSGDGIYIWNPDSLSNAASFVINSRGSREVAFSPYGRQLASASLGATLKIWNVTTGQEERSFEFDGAVNNVSYDPGGSKIATVVSANNRSDVVLLDPLTGETISRWHAHDQAIYHLEFSPKGHLVGTASVDGTVRIWDAMTGRLRYQLPGYETVYGEIAFSSDERLLATCEDLGVTISEAQNGNRLFHLAKATEPVAFTPDGLHLACHLDGVIRLVDVKTGDISQSFLSTTRGLSRIAFSPDGKRMWAIGERGALTIFDSQSGTQLASFDTEYNQLHSIAISTDGKTVATSTTDGQIILWETGDRSSSAAERHLVSRARRVVDELAAELTFSDDVIAAIRSASALDEAVRNTALHIASVQGDNAYLLNSKSAGIVRVTGRLPSEYKLALRMANASCAKVPDNGTYLSTLGIAQYRVGDCESALESLTKAHGTAVPTEDRYIVEMAFLAMAHADLGDQASAGAVVDQLQQSLATDAWSVRDDLRALFDEVLEIVGAKGDHITH